MSEPVESHTFKAMLSYLRVRAFLEPPKSPNSFFCNLSCLSGCQEPHQTWSLGQNFYVDMPREESWHKGLYKVRYVKLQANSLVITQVGWAWHVCSSRKKEAKQLRKGLEPALVGAQESSKGLNNHSLRKAEVKDSVISH